MSFPKENQQFFTWSLLPRPVRPAVLLEKKNIIFFLKETTGRTGRGFLGHPLGIRKSGWVILRLLHCQPDPQIAILQRCSKKFIGISALKTSKRVPRCDQNLRRLQKTLSLRQHGTNSSSLRQSKRYSNTMLKCRSHRLAVHFNVYTLIRRIALHSMHPCAKKNAGSVYT